MVRGLDLEQCWLSSGPELEHFVFFEAACCFGVPGDGAATDFSPVASLKLSHVRDEW